MKRLLPVLMGFALLLLSSTEGWSLPPCPTDSHVSTWTDCFGTTTTSRGSKYVGEFNYGKFNGQGTAINPDGRSYVGAWMKTARAGSNIAESAFRIIDIGATWEVPALPSTRAKLPPAREEVGR